MASGLADIGGEIHAETDKAYQFFDGKRTVWLPKSQCEWDPNDKTITMPLWLAEEKELV
jgi:hypothetical protein